MSGDESSRISIAFGWAIKLRRVEIGFSQEELADKAELASSFVSGIERGLAKASTTSVWKIAKALKCNPSDIWLMADG